MNSKEQLTQFKQKIDCQLEEYFATKLKEAEKISPSAYEMMQYIADLTLRSGKRIRAALLYYSYLAHGGQDRTAAIKISMSMELSETFLLIHDDIMDNDALRRNGDTIHESYRKICHQRYHGRTIASHFGRSIAMLAGDIACGLSNEIIAESQFPAELLNKALLELNKIYVVECYGQAMDVFSELSDNISKDDVVLIQKLKTVPYTFDGPVKIGAILAGIEKERVLKLENYSVPLGVAFQIQDDVLGIFGSVKKTGKPITSDLREGKKTLLILDAKEKANKSQLKIINQNLGNKRASITDLKNVRQVIMDTGSFDESKKTAEKLVKKSIDSLQSLNLEAEGKDFLVGIADWMIKREY